VAELQPSFRVKLLAIVASSMLALVVVIAGSAVSGLRQGRDLLDVERRMLPRLLLAPQLESEFEQLGRQLQDAVAAQDTSALDEGSAIKARIFETIASAKDALDPHDAATVRWKIEDYYDTALDVSRRLLAGETGEKIIADMRRMQEKQKESIVVIRRATGMNRDELSSTFADMHAANAAANTFRLGIGLSGLVMGLALSIWVSRGMLAGLGSLSRGFARFGTSDFDHQIVVSSDRDLGRVAHEANQMAASLKRLNQHRDRSDWLRQGQAGLSDELRGELDPISVAHRALSFIARRIEAQVGAMYLKGDGDVLHLAAQYGVGESPVTPADSSARARESFHYGEGLVGEAALRDELTILDTPPAGYLTVQSGLGKADPTSILFMPLMRAGGVVGLIELALFKPLDERAREFLMSVRQMLATTIGAAEAQAEQRRLLATTQELATRLAAQEEELRLNNQELQVQQEELRKANQELEAQRQVLSVKNAELDEARRRVQQKADELERVSSYKSQFLANMSHELRTPLNSMLLLSHLLAENESGNLTAKQVEHSRTIHGAGQDLLALINQVLDLSKIEAGKQECEIESVPLTHFAEQARRVFAPLAQDKGIELVIEIVDGAPHAIATDRLRLERILTNLLGNAIKFTDHGEVTLRIGRPAQHAQFQRNDVRAGEAVAFAVSDTGIGIPLEAQARVFAPFEQVEGRSDRRYAGTGLGLAIARESATLLGGELQLVSAPGKGSTFTCYLPERPALAAEKGLRTKRPAPEISSVGDDVTTIGADDGYILVVEDDAVLAEQLVEIIRERKVKVVVTGSGVDGVELARKRAPLGIILDVKLPDIDGWEVMERLRREPSTRQIPVHFVSGIDAPERGLAMGAVGYLTKPASRTELANAIRTLTSPSPSESSRILVVEDNLAEGEAIVEVLRCEGLEANHVRSAAAALKALDTDNYGCIVLDLGLPDMDGLALLEMRASRTDVAMPRIIVHTGRALTRKEIRQLELYAQAIIVKDASSAERLLDEIRLFVRHVADALPARHRASHAEDPGKDVSFKGKTILLAEDDMRTVYAISALLRGKGAEVLVADNGREALELLDGHPDVGGVLMDVMMPEMDGYEAMKRLREDTRFRKLPVIALTAKAMKGEKERCIEAGASAYLAKPVDSQRLLVTLQSWLSKGETNGARH
jgi:CheY-like chemotaxis protein/signal transduction histidine kinase